MNVEIVGHNRTRIEAMIAYRRVRPSLTLSMVKVIIDTIEEGHPVPLNNLNEDEVKSLVNDGFILEFPTNKEIKQLMNQLIKRLLKTGKKKYANQLISMWIEMQKEEDNNV